MTLRHMQIFAAVCRENSITAAANKLNMAQPAVSLAVKELETFYGVRLFERMNRRLYITDAGQKLSGYADTIVSQFEDSVNSIRNAGTACSLRVGVNVTIGEAFLPGVLKEYRTRYPGISVKTVIENSKQTEELLLRNEIDLAIVDNVSVSPNFIAEVLFKEEMAVLCGAEYTDKRTMTLGELASEKLLLREKGSGTRDSIDQIFDMSGYRITPVMESISSTALINAAALGLGITILSRHCMTDNNLTEINVPDAHFLRNYFVVYHKSKYVTTAMKNFISMFVK